MKGLTVQKTTEAAAVGKTILVYGESGAGKSTLLGTLPGRTLVLDVEGGLTVLRKAERVDRIRIPESLENLKEVFAGITGGAADPAAFPWANICLDSASELEKFMLIRLAAVSKNDGMPSLHDYGVTSFRMRDYMRQLRDLRERGLNVIVTCLEMPLELEQSDNSIRTRLYPMLARKLAPEICGLFDIVARLEISQKPGAEGRRFLRMDGNEQIVAKNRYGNGGFADAHLGRVFAAIDGGLPMASTFEEPQAAAPKAQTQAAAKPEAPATRPAPGRPAPRQTAAKQG